MDIDFNPNLLHAVEVVRADLKALEEDFDADTMARIGLKKGDIVRKGHYTYQVRRASVSPGYRQGDPPELFIVANRLYKDGSHAWSASYLSGRDVEKVQTSNEAFGAAVASLGEETDA